MIRTKLTEWSATFEPFTVVPAEEIKKALLKSGGCKVTKDGKTIGVVTDARVKNDEVTVDIKITSKIAAEKLAKKFDFTIEPSVSYQNK